MSGVGPTPPLSPGTSPETNQSPEEKSGSVRRKKSRIPQSPTRLPSRSKSATRAEWQLQRKKGGRLRMGGNSSASRISSESPDPQPIASKKHKSMFGRVKSKIKKAFRGSKPYARSGQASSFAEPPSAGAGNGRMRPVVSSATRLRPMSTERKESHRGSQSKRGADLQKEQVAVLHRKVDRLETKEAKQTSRIEEQKKIIEELLEYMQKLGSRPLTKKENKDAPNSIQNLVDQLLRVQMKGLLGFQDRMIEKIKKLSVWERIRLAFDPSRLSTLDILEAKNGSNWALQSLLNGLQDQGKDIPLPVYNQSSPSFWSRMKKGAVKCLKQRWSDLQKGASNCVKVVTKPFFDLCHWLGNYIRQAKLWVLSRFSS